MSEAGACGRMALLVQADHDGELGAAESASVLAHVATCPRCAALRVKLAATSRALADDRFRHRAPARVRAVFAPPRPPVLAASGAGALAGAALAACVALAVLPPRQGPDASVLLVDSHLRALQPGHLMDVVSTDRHTVKPWFDGRLDYAPPVQDFAAAGFPLKGARLDYLMQRPVAALVYGRDRHLIDVYVFPAEGLSARQATLRGYNIIAWSQGGMAFWAVSDLNAADLARFRALWGAAR